MSTLVSSSSHRDLYQIHIHLEDQAGGGFMPLYLKTHSMGEYVFDYVWANAYHHHGFNYYPT